MKSALRYLLPGLILSSLCQAATAQGWSPPLTVESVFTEDSDLIIAYTSGDPDPALTPGCQRGSWSFKASTEDRRNRAYSTLLAATLSGKKIRFWHRDVCGPWNYHEATSVMIVKQ